jgi:hypothetical protein
MDRQKEPQKSKKEIPIIRKKLKSSKRNSDRQKVFQIVKKKFR